MKKETQEHQVIEAMRKEGGYATLRRLNEIVDFSSWKTKTPEATVRRIVQLSKQFLLGMIKSHQLAERLFHALLPVREGKHNNRPLNHHSKMPAFNYRVI